ncbi:MAG TPA: PQQ-binding-like beta-propeller repeat protein, partial [Pirellulaceae bacterium]|nr:PQQ-binding-like beta-propeller repeat protein [Pirellulaceae bacterium]
WCFDAEPKQLWKVPLADGSLAGIPLEATGSLILATRSGMLVRLAADSGKEQARIDLSQPLAAMLAGDGEQVFVATADGCLLKAALPKESATEP